MSSLGKLYSDWFFGFVISVAKNQNFSLCCDF